METPRGPTFLSLRFEPGEEGLSGSLTALGRTLAIDELTAREGGVRALLGTGADTVVLDLRPEAGGLSGVWKQGEEAFPLELKSIPRYPEPPSRSDAWRQDLDALSERFLAFDRSFSPAERALFRERIRGLAERLPEIGDAEMIMEMASAVALSGNAHTRLYLLRNRTELRRLPIRVWWFDDGLYVVRTTTPHRDLLGCRVSSIEGVPVRRARQIVSRAFAGNPSWTDYKSVYYLTSPEALHGFGVARDPEAIEFELTGCRPESFLRSLAPEPLARSDEPAEAWRDLSPRHRRPGWAHVLDATGVALPLHLGHPERHYWFDFLVDEGLLYLQYNRAAEMPEEGLRAFGDRLLAALDAENAQAFVLDLRFNTGGSLGLAEDLMREIEERTREIPRYAVIGRATFSAGLSHAVVWKGAEGVTLVGEGVGDELDYWSEGGNIVLPNSGLTAHFANGFHSYSLEPCPETVPCFLDLGVPDLELDLPVSTSWDEYAAGVDPALEAVRAALR